ncbi:MAG: cation-translocating P-type ATPase [candidate division KSB1 bacterium]|nr:cation-translocating P-type ATPase [candidate division KSB1 bacterium]
MNTNIIAGEPVKPIPWHTLTTDAALKELNVDAQLGLNHDEATARLDTYGPNELIERRKKHPLMLLLEQFGSMLVIILIVAAVISGFLGKPTETIAILAIVFLFAILGFVQEYRAEKAMAALKKLTVPIVRVRRNGELLEISARDLVPGDIIILEAGNLVPADARLIDCVNLKIQEAALTGESDAVEKNTAALARTDLTLGDRINMAYMGTMVTYGHGEAVAVATGMNTQLGRVAALIQEVEHEMTPLQRRLNQVGKFMAICGFVTAAMVMIIGLLNGQTWSDMFLTAVSVAVAVVPEGLPAVVTVTLALGAQRMLKRHALIRKLPAVETLGSVTVICSDKTGTLTENRMTVTVIDVAGEYLELFDSLHHPAPSLSPLSLPDSSQDIFENKPETIFLVLMGGALCNDATLKPDPVTNRVQTIGDPTEGALLVAASRAGIFKNELQNDLPRVAEVPFDSSRKRMTTIHQLPTDLSRLPEQLLSLKTRRVPYVAFTKGAVDSLLEVASHVWVDNQPVILDKQLYERIKKANDQLAAKGMRVLGVALKWLDALPQNKALEQTEQNLIMLGLIGMIDPPRPEVKQAVATCKAAGIRPIMITGDHPLTARFIANELGIVNNGNFKTGQELNQMSDAEIEAAVTNTSVFARVSPEHKLKIVQALQKHGEVVAMTGDGVNDSPALKQANIGVAMGITGTDVSKDAADMVLLDDNFATIVAAVEEGRVIYDNIRRFVKFSMAGNLGKVLVMLLTPLMGISVALLPLQLLWLNLLTDGLLGLGLGLEPAERNTMRRSPRSPQASFFADRLGIHVIWVGFLIGILGLALTHWFFKPNSPDDKSWQSVLFTSIAFMQIGQAMASRSIHKRSFNLDYHSNPVMFAMVGLTFFLQLAAIYSFTMRQFFEVPVLTPLQLMICIVAGGVVYALVKLEKLVFLEKEIK